VAVRDRPEGDREPAAVEAAACCAPGTADGRGGRGAKATNNTDLSWLTGFVVSGGLYYILRPILAPHERAEAAVTH
jgi:hypothetical protein